MRIPSLLLAGAVAVTGLAIYAQTKPPSSTSEPLFHSYTREVPLYVTVADKKGHYVTNLQENAFKVYENGVLQPIHAFRYEDLPVSLALVIDNSGSMRDKRQAVEAAALALVRDSNPQDETFVVNFNEDAYLDVDFTSDVDKLKIGLERIDSRGQTAMREAVRLAIEHLHEKGKRDKKVVLVVTDGEDNYSDPDFSMEKLVQLASKDDVLVYAIGLLDQDMKSEANRAKRALNDLVQSTGGEVFYPKNLAEVDGIAHQVAGDLRNQYFIGYTPLNEALDGTFRQVKVLVKAPGNPVPRTRPGYWANPPETK
ncbi:MAG TPA: VWA domain-containing protein [Bryobacteraceae bacterium]|nr:VWA domain-containing protein [Bryobacteraceae bacterium]